MTDGLFVLILLLIFVGMTDCLHCLEGSDCVHDASCGECSGVACARVVSHNLDDNKEVALTCLPFDTRTYHNKQLEEEGCRVIGDRQTCICYSHDYCNSMWNFRTSFNLKLAGHFIFLLLIL